MRLKTMTLTAAALLATATALLTSTASAGAGGAAGAVYTLTNETGGNAVAVFDRAGDGTLTPAGTVSTGGLGTGGGLNSQGAIVLDGHRLFAVNAGSNEISAFAVRSHGLILTDVAPSGGVLPISVTVYGDLVYVLNKGTPGNITGFRVGSDGSLTPIPGSTRPLSAPAVNPAQVQFSPDGGVLVVTEKATNRIDTYVVGGDGLASGPNVFPSASPTPFGFDFDKHGRLIVSEAVFGGAGLSVLSSYSVSSGGALTVISPSVPDGQTAACWVVITNNGRYAYTTNTGSDNVSSYTIGHDGSLALLAAVAAPTGDEPIDADVSRNSRYLYTLDLGSQGISEFDIAGDGGLTPVSFTGGLPASAVGLAAS